MTILQSDFLQKFNNEIYHFISIKPFSFRCPFYNWWDKNKVLAHKLDLAHALNIENKKLIFLNQTHSTNIHIIDNNNYREEVHADAVITSTPWVMICVLASDCLPILLYNSKTQYIWAIHAGWRWLFSDIIPKTIQAMQWRPSDISVFIWPSISYQNYEVWNDFITIVPSFFRDCIHHSPHPQKIYFNLKKWAKNQLLSLWLLEDNIEVSSHCTYTDNTLFHSYRRKTHFWDQWYGNNAFGICLWHSTKNN